jgi:hypothetical protein
LRFLVVAIAISATTHNGPVAHKKQEPCPRADSVVLVGSQRLRLQTDAYRDFMPRLDVRRTGSDLMVNLRIQSIEDILLPRGLTVDSVWVTSAEGSWATVP